MTMRIKVDEDLPSEVVELLQASGHDAVSVIDQNMRGWKDDALWAAVQREVRLLITADKGFGDLRSHRQAHTRECCFSDPTRMASVH